MKILAYTIDHIPSQCNGCPNHGICVSCGAESRYELDINIDVKVTKHKAVSFEYLKENGKTIKGNFPENITSTMQYGNNLEALVVSLNTAGMVSINRTHEILNAVFNVPICTGTIHGMVKSCASKIKGTYE